MIADSKRPGEGVGSMRTRGRGQKLAKSCGRLLWMAPYKNCCLGAQCLQDKEHANYDDTL